MSKERDTLKGRFGNRDLTDYFTNSLFITSSTPGTALTKGNMG